MPFQMTVGMALYDQGPTYYESCRAVFTIMSLLAHHGDRVAEIVVVDNNPDGNNPLAEWPAKTKNRVRYVEMPEPVGTAAPRNRVFEEAAFDHVMVIDPHVLLLPGSLAAVEDFYRAHGDDCPDVLHGWMMTEQLKPYATHMNDQWREEMLGTWGWAWACPHTGNRFSVIDKGDHVCTYVSLPDGADEQRELTPAEIGELGLPENLTVYGNERVLESLGFRQPSVPFPVPGHGMGLWACRKDAWLPFHEKCKGFGGEEITTGKRFRAAGRRTWSLPGVRWWHHFHRPQNRVPYLLTVYDKVRNYCLEFQRLGLDPQPIYDHFFKGRNRPEGDWEAAKAGLDWPPMAPGVNPLTYAAGRAESLARQQYERRTPGMQQSRQPNGEEPAVPPVHHFPQGIEGFYTAVVAAPSPYNQDLPHLRHLAATCRADGTPGDVVEVVHQAASVFALVAAKPRSVTSYGGLPPHRASAVTANLPAGTAFQAVAGAPHEIPGCDLLFLDVSPHTSAYYARLFERYAPSVRRWIAVHDTTTYGDVWNDQPGLKPAIDAFIADNPDWHRVGAWETPNGLALLSRNPDDGGLPATPPELMAPLAVPVSAPVTIPTEGVGTELKAILASLGINPSPTCDCNAKAGEMNRAGVEWVKANRDVVVGWLKEGADRWGWSGVAKAVVTHPLTAAKLAARVNWVDPFPGLVDEAIRRYEEKKGGAA